LRPPRQCQTPKAQVASAKAQLLHSSLQRDELQARLKAAQDSELELKLGLTHVASDVAKWREALKPTLQRLQVQCQLQPPSSLQDLEFRVDNQRRLVAEATSRLAASEQAVLGAQGAAERLEQLCRASQAAVRKVARSSAELKRSKSDGASKPPSAGNAVDAIQRESSLIQSLSRQLLSLS
jgi:hypothetical protein